MLDELRDVLGEPSDDNNATLLSPAAIKAASIRRAANPPPKPPKAPTGPTLVLRTPVAHQTDRRAAGGATTEQAETPLPVQSNHVVDPQSVPPAPPLPPETGDSGAATVRQPARDSDQESEAGRVLRQLQAFQNASAIPADTLAKVPVKLTTASVVQQPAVPPKLRSAASSVVSLRDTTAKRVAGATEEAANVQLVASRQPTGYVQPAATSGNILTDVLATWQGLATQLAALQARFDDVAAQVAQQAEYVTNGVQPARSVLSRASRADSVFTSASQQRADSWAAQSTAALNAGALLTHDQLQNGQQADDPTAGHGRRPRAVGGNRSRERAMPRDATPARLVTVLTSTNAANAGNTHQQVDVAVRQRRDDSTPKQNGGQSSERAAVADSGAARKHSPCRARFMQNALTLPAVTAVKQEPDVPRKRYDSASDDDADVRRSNRTSHRSVKPRPYLGDGYVEQYLEQFKCTARLAGWPKEEWGLQLIGALEGKARRIITTDLLSSSETPSYEQVSEVLRKSFGSDASPPVYLATLERRVRKDKESLFELSQTIMELAAKAYPALGHDDRQRLSVGYFTRALTDREQRMHVMTARPTDLSHALEVALAYENAARIDDDVQARQRHGGHTPRVRAYEQSQPQAADRPPRGRSSGRGGSRQGEQRSRSVAPRAVLDDHVRQIRDMVNELGEQVRQVSMTAQPQASATQPDRPVSSRDGEQTGGNPRSNGGRQGRAAGAERPQGCFICGDTDHWRRECPQRNTSNRDRARSRGRQENWRGRGANGQPHGQEF